LSGEKGEEVAKLTLSMIPFIIVLIILTLDQTSKILLSRSLYFDQTLPLIRGVFDITLVHNRGAAFGIFKGQVYLFIIASSVAVFLIYSSLKSKKHSIYYVASLSFILAGALGNLIDRVRLGYVIDFFNFHFWPVFNIADSAITIGSIILAWLIFKGKD